MTHRWRELTYLVNRPKVKLMDELLLLHSPGSTLFLLVRPLPPVNARGGV